MTRLAIFDLDGTLLNTIGDLAVSCNAVLALRGLPQHSYEDYCRFVGNGIMRLVERALPEALRTPYTVDAVRRDFVAYYLAHIDEHTLPYEGIPELLDELQRWGVRLAVASNKFQAGTEKLIGRYFPDIRFDVVLGQRPDALRGRFGGGHADGRRRRRPFGGRHVGVPHACRVGAERCPAHRRPPCGVARTVVIFPVGSSEPDSSLVINGKRNLREIPFSVLCGRRYDWQYLCTSSIVMVSPLRMMSRSITLRSSRTLPLHRIAESASMASESIGLGGMP